MYLVITDLQMSTQIKYLLVYKVKKIMKNINIEQDLWRYFMLIFNIKKKNWNIGAGAIV